MSDNTLAGAILDDSSGTLRPAALRILEHTIKVIETEGESEVRTRDIAQHCGVTAPILYRAFGSREGLIVVAHAERYRRLLASFGGELARRVAATLTVDQFVAVVSDEISQLLSPDRVRERLTQAEVRGSAVTRPELRRVVQEVELEAARWLADALRPIQDRGWLRANLDLDAFSRWALDVVSSRVVVDLSVSVTEMDDWDERTARVIIQELMGLTQ